MSRNNLTRWIEAADARKFDEETTFARNAPVTESHYLDLGTKIAKLPSWLRRNVTHEPPAVVACPRLGHIHHRQLRRVV